MTIASFHCLTCRISTLYSLRYLCPDPVRMSTPLLPTRRWSWTPISMTYRSNTGRYRATSPLSSNPTSKQSRESNHYMYSMSDPHSEDDVSWLKCLQFDSVLINLNIMILNCLWFCMPAVSCDVVTFMVEQRAVSVECCPRSTRRDCSISMATNAESWLRR